MAEKINPTAPAEQEKNPLIVELPKAYTFEGKAYNEIDLRGIEKLTVQDACDIQKALVADQNVAAINAPEGTVAYAAEVAARAAKLPIEFFRLLPMGAMRRVRGAFMQYINVEQNEGAAMKFEAPYVYDGETYKDIDLANVEMLTCLDLTEAEKQLARAGHVIVETSTDYLCCCILAAKATGKPVEFFTGLPLREASKLRNTVNAIGFFE